MSTLFGREHSKRWQFYCGCWWYLSPNRFSISLYLAHSNTFSYIFCIKYINMLSIYLWFENPQVIYIREKGRRTVRAGTEGLHISERGTERAHFHIVGKSFTYIAVCFIFCLLAGCAWGTIVMIKRYNGMRCKIMCATIKKKWVNVCVGEREREKQKMKEKKSDKKQKLQTVCLCFVHRISRCSSVCMHVFGTLYMRWAQHMDVDIRVDAVAVVRILYWNVSTL